MIDNQNPDPVQSAWKAWASESPNRYGSLLREAFEAGFNVARQWSIDEEAAEIAWEMALEGRPLTAAAQERLRQHVAKERARTSRLNRLAERLEAQDD
ncbi:hypothetical protein [Nocardioides jiangxiensis]|uniref:Uncharacterized protein n=1 Tax=Nocardioides jiangxiensis TaxID=3064524 RepID=A0ABT9AZZ4_9ACTN|nr:hypothetical protein [Nocardioides sp. WY-20]MDO7868160.1 hypothetical protein [Nocardioides sp. WY-20]